MLKLSEMLALILCISSCWGVSKVVLFFRLSISFCEVVYRAINYWEIGRLLKMVWLTFMISIYPNPSTS